MQNNKKRFSDLGEDEQFKVDGSPLVLKRIGANAAMPVPYCGSLVTFNNPDELVEVIGFSSENK